MSFPPPPARHQWSIYDLGSGVAPSCLRYWLVNPDAPLWPSREVSYGNVVDLPGHPEAVFVASYPTYRKALIHRNKLEVVWKREWREAYDRKMHGAEV